MITRYPEYMIGDMPSEELIQSVLAEHALSLPRLNRLDRYYRGDGAHGQYCIVMDDKDAVVAINTEDSNENYQGLIDAVWEEILPRL